MRLFLILISIIVAASAVADDLYHVSIHSEREAAFVREAEVRPIMSVAEGFLVLMPEATAEQLKAQGIEPALIKSEVKLGQLGQDRRRDRINAARFEILYESGDQRLLYIPGGLDQITRERLDVLPCRDDLIRVEFHPAAASADPLDFRDEDLTWLLDLISQDTISAYLHTLEAFDGRLAGTPSNYAARDWIESKFLSFGYDTVYMDPFTGEQLWDYTPVDCYNVVAVKPGTLFPEKQIIIGGHFDAVPESPGADDNGSGTTAVLELARALVDIDLPMTIVFIAFDSEESWMWGSYHYRDEAVARGDDIMLMVNPDMIGEITNSDWANLYHGSRKQHAQLWQSLAEEYVGIYASLSGSTASDHLPFQEAGFNVIFVQEGYFSPQYHSPQDSTSYIDFEYMTRMIQATIATVYTTAQSPPPVDLLKVEEPGDGQSKFLTWEAFNRPTIAGYMLSATPALGGTTITAVVQAPDTTGYITGLTPNVSYRFYVRTIDAEMDLSIVWNELISTPYIEPRPPEDLKALPEYQAISMHWSRNNVEFDFDHYEVVRDGQFIGVSYDSTFYDADPSLGSGLHAYYVIAVDHDGNESDTVNVEPCITRAATLQPGRILAVNRSNTLPGGLVDEVETGVYLRDALVGYDFDYYSDTVAISNPYDTCKLNLIDMVEYSLIIVADESGRYDNIGADGADFGILDTLAYFNSIGGKVIIFGRFGDFYGPTDIDYLATATPDDDAYYYTYHVGSRTQTYTNLVAPACLISDLIGAKSVAAGFPTLIWDSLMTVHHSASLTECTGVPFVSFLTPRSSGPEIVYTYDSRDDNQNEDQPVAWRYTGEDYGYYLFDVPLSFFGRAQAVTALRTAVDDLLGGGGPCCVLRGDINHDGAGPDISDLVYLANYSFSGGPAPYCMDEANINGDGDTADISDLVHLVTYMFQSGPPPLPCPADSL